METSLYGAICEAWNLKDEDRARQLEDQLMKAFSDPISQYQDGCISASELLNQLLSKANAGV